MGCSRHRQSGGAVTAILAQALDDGFLDAVVTVTEDRWHSDRHRWSLHALICSSTRRAASTWWVPLLAALKQAVIEKKYRKIAVVGVPCVVQALTRMRESDNNLLKPYGTAIRLVIGLFHGNL